MKTETVKKILFTPQSTQLKYGYLYSNTMQEILNFFISIFLKLPETSCKSVPSICHKSVICEFYSITIFL